MKRFPASGLIGVAVVAGLLVQPTAMAAAPAANSSSQAAAEAAAAAEPAEPAGAAATARWTEVDWVAPRAANRLRLPWSSSGRLAASAQRKKARYRFAISVVAVPVAGKKLGATKKSMASMVNRVGRRMEQQTGSRIGYRFTSWARAPRIKDADLPCNVDKIYNRYGSLAKGLRRTPRGYRDTIAVFITPRRSACRFAGSAMLGGDGTYLNGVDLRDRQRLQDWITAHELGHNLSLVHSGAFVPSSPGWDPATDSVPQNDRSHNVAEYGDYLDLMGAPPRSRDRIRGADFAKWTLDSVSQLNLGVMTDNDVEFVESAGTYGVAALQPKGTSGAVSTLAIPVTADRSPTFWLIEYRPAAENERTVNYPPPWSTAGYGVRLILYEHVSRGWYHINKVLRLARRSAGLAVLPVWQWVRLGGGSTVGIVAADPTAATVRVFLAPQRPDEPVVPPAPEEPGPSAAPEPPEPPEPPDPAAG